MMDTRPAFVLGSGERCKCANGWHEPGSEGCRFAPDPEEQPERTANKWDDVPDWVLEDGAVWQARAVANEATVKTLRGTMESVMFNLGTKPGITKAAAVQRLAAALRGTETLAKEGTHDES